MKYYLCWVVLIAGEVIGVPLLGFAYSQTHSKLLLYFLIIGIALVFITSLLCVLSIRHKEKKEDHPKDCPYFIDKDFID